MGIARAIVTHPKVVVADEPTGDLDPETSVQILRLLERINEELGVTLLMVTHDAEAGAIAGARFDWSTASLSRRGGRRKPS